MNNQEASSDFFMLFVTSTQVSVADAELVSRSTACCPACYKLWHYEYGVCARHERRGDIRS